MNFSQEHSKILFWQRSSTECISSALYLVSRSLSFQTAWSINSLSSKWHLSVFQLAAQDYIAQRSLFLILILLTWPTVVTLAWRKKRTELTNFFFLPWKGGRELHFQLYSCKFSHFLNHALAFSCYFKKLRKSLGGNQTKGFFPHILIWDYSFIIRVCRNKLYLHNCYLPKKTEKIEQWVCKHGSKALKRMK